MTALEQKLRKQLELQQEAFIRELKQITSSYEMNMNEAKNVIAEQNKTLGRYGSVSKNWEIRINQEQLDELERVQSERVQNLSEQLSKQRESNQLLASRMQNLSENLSEQLKVLESKLESMSRADEDLVGQLNGALKKL